MNDSGDWKKEPEIGCGDKSLLCTTFLNGDAPPMPILLSFLDVEGLTSFCCSGFGINIVAWM